MPSGASLTFAPPSSMSPGPPESCCDHARCELSPAVPESVTIPSFLERLVSVMGQFISIFVKKLN